METAEPSRRDSRPAWDLPDPFTIEHRVGGDEIDEYGHANNAVYFRWLDRVAWAHAAAVGAGADAHVGMRRGMAAHRSEVHFVAPAFEGDRLQIANWIVYCDGRLRAWRRFQILRVSDGKTLLRALFQYVCIDLDSGRPRRMPELYRERYVVLPSVARRLESEESPFAIAR